MFDGMTIHNILEKVDLLNFVFEEDGGNDSPKKNGVSKDSGSGKVIKSSIDPTSAYLGM